MSQFFMLNHSAQKKNNSAKSLTAALESIRISTKIDEATRELIVFSYDDGGMMISVFLVSERRGRWRKDYF